MLSKEREEGKGQGQGMKDSEQGGRRNVKGKDKGKEKCARTKKQGGTRPRVEGSGHGRKDKKGRIKEDEGRE
jgi:hypothetical protein